MPETLNNLFLRSLVEDDEDGVLLAKSETMSLRTGQVVYEADEGRGG